MYATLFCNTDSCSKQYRCTVALNLLSTLVHKHNISIERLVGAPGHGKGYVDGLNVVDQNIWRRVWCLSKHPVKKFLT